MGRIIVFTGKGGVGKTSVAAAHAVKSAGEGKKTLLVSADMAHNLGDIFRIEVGSKPVLAGENLWLQELAPDELMREEFPNAKFILEPTTALCSFYAEEGGLIIGFEGDFNSDNDNRVH